MSSIQLLGIAVSNLNRDLGMIKPDVRCISTRYFSHYSMLYLFSIAGVHHIAHNELKIRYFCPHFIDNL